MTLLNILIKELNMEVCRSDAEKALVNYYLTGGGGRYVETKPFMRGSGFVDILAGIGRTALPLLKSAGKYLGRKGVSLLANTAQDALSGKNVVSALKNNASAALENTKYDLVQAVGDKMNLRKRKKQRVKPKNKKRAKQSRLW